MVRADRVEDELAARVVQLGRDESLCLLLGEVAADDGERLLGARRPVAPDDRAFDSDVPVRKRLLLNAEADDARRLDQLGLARPPTLGPGEEGDVATRLVVVPDRSGVRRTLTAGMASTATCGSARKASRSASVSGPGMAPP